MNTESVGNTSTPIDSFIVPTTRMMCVVPDSEIV